METSLFRKELLPVRQYRVKTPFVAVSPPALDGTMQSTILEPGGIIKVEREHTTRPSGLVEIVYGGKHLRVYLRDLQDRSEPVVEAPAAEA